MHNFRHETPPPDDAVIYRLLRDDYFHDSWIDALQFDRLSDTLDLRLWCEREWSEGRRHCWERGVGWSGVPELTADQQKAAKSPESPWYRNYVYHVRFHGCAGVELVLPPVRWFSLEYSNGRFKDTVALRDAERRPRRKLLQFRIQLGCDGYIDVIFARVSVEREVGRMRLQALPRGGRGGGRLRLAPDRRPAAALTRVVLESACEFEREAALLQLQARRHPDAAVLAERLVKRALGRRAFDAYQSDLVAGIYVLGLRGSARHVPLLAKAAEKVDTPLFRRHVQDALERIAAPRRINYGEDAAIARLQRVCEFAELGAG
jgi:hypothetical protein